MKKSYKSLLVACILLSVIGVLAFFTPGTAFVSASADRYEQQMKKTFKKHEILKLDKAKLAKQVKQTGKATIATSQESFELVLTPHDMRSHDYYAEETVEGGASHRLKPTPVNTFKGKAHGRQESDARFTIDDDNFEGVMITPNDLYIIEPARKYALSADPSDFVFYTASDVIEDSAGTCSVTLDKEISSTANQVLSELSSGERANSEAIFSPNLDAELATEADYEFVTRFGGSTGANNEILSILNQVEGVYQSQLGITFTITVAAQHTWNTPSDPYSSTNPEAMLGEFRNYWNSNFSSIKRDIAHMWTGRDMDGTPIGIAYVGVVCRAPGSSYGVSQVWTGTPGKFILSAHEIGHNFGARHPDQLGRTDCGNTIMQSSVGTGFSFCQFSVDEITSHVTSYSSCLSAGTTQTPAQITSPANGSTFSSSTVTFNWSPVSNTISYYLDIGNSQGTRDIYGSSVSGGSTTVSGLPTDGRTLYVRLWSQISGVWQFRDYSYKASTTNSATPAQITSPVNGSTFSSSTVTFTWGPVSNAVTYYFDVGNSLGTRDIYGNFASGGSTTVSGLPTDGRTLYVRLWSQISGVWQFRDYSYKAFTVSTIPAQITSPVNGSTFSSSTVTFTWGPVSNGVSYYFDVGNSLGARDIYGNFTSGGSTTVSGLPTDGRTLYVRLWSQINGVWQFRDYSYKAFTVSTIPAQITSPASGSTLSSSTVTFNWGPVLNGVTYYFDVGNALGTRDIYGNFTSGGSTTVSLPTDGRTLYVRLWSQINGVWQFRDYNYKAVNTGPTTAQITSPANGSTLTSSTVTFTWNPVPAATLYYMWIGNSPASQDIFFDYVSNGTTTIAGLPTDGRTIYVRLWSYINGAWVGNNYSYKTCSGCSGINPNIARITSPANGSTFSSSTVTFFWTPVVNSTLYYMWIGSSPGSSDIYANYVAGGASTISAIPTDGRTIYVKMWSNVNGVWLANDYIYFARL